MSDIVSACLAIAIVAIAALIFNWTDHKVRSDHCIGRTVSEIGGCDRNGVCGVVYSDGSRGTQEYPTVGGKCE